MNNTSQFTDPITSSGETEGDIVRITAELVSVYLGNSSVSGSDLPALVEHLPVLIKRIHGALAEARDANRPQIDPSALNLRPSVAPPPLDSDDAPRGAGAAELIPAVPIADSITPDYIVCLENGGHYRSLRPHLRSAYGLTPEAYRIRWGLPPDYPMVAPNYSKERSSVAKRSGLGRSPTVANGGRRKVRQIERAGATG